MTGISIETLSEEAKIWTAKAIAGVIIADDVLKKEELKIFREAISFLDNTKLVNQIINQIKKRSLPEPEVFETDRKTAVQIIMILAHAAFVDTELSCHEIDYIVTAGKKIGLSKRYITRVINWNQEYVQIELKRDKLLSDGYKSKVKYV
jgi:hypothetical protein